MCREQSTLKILLNYIKCAKHNLWHDYCVIYHIAGIAIFGIA